MDTNVIKVSNLYKTYKVIEKKSFWRDLFFPRYKNVNAVNGISFEIKKGESVAFLGPNGAGKTTTTKMLSGLILPSSGKVTVLGHIPFDRHKEFLMKIGLIMGNKTGIDWDLTARQSFGLNQKIYRIPKATYEKSFNELTELLDVSKLLDIQIRRLSLGERLKMELVGSILHQPEILFLDEPTIGLDVPSKQKIREFLRTIQKSSDVTMLLTSHDMDDVEKVTDRVVVINDGQIIFDDSMPNLLYKYKNKKYLTLIFTEKVKSHEIKKYGKIIEKKPLSYTIEINSNDQTKIITSILDKLPVDDIDVIHVPLEEIISDMFNGSKEKV